jgi:uncharacterized membrane protein
MTWAIIAAWIHYVGVMLMIASLLGEHLMLKQVLSGAEARAIQRLDIIFGGSATVILVTGIMRMYLEKAPPTISKAVRSMPSWGSLFWWRCSRSIRR